MKRLFAFILAAAAISMFVPTTLARAEFVEDTDDTFTIVWLSDTQDMAYHGYGGAMAEIGKWIADNRATLDIRYVIQTGDAVDNGVAPRQWAEFDTMYNQFKEQIPYIMAAGNHEVKKDGYLEYLMRPEVQAIPDVNAYAGGKASYSTFEVDGCKLIFFAIGYGVEQEAVTWVNSVLQKHNDCTAILLYHDYMQTAGRFSINGKAMFKQVIVTNKNVRLVLSGHVCGVSSRVDEIDDTGDGIADRTVTQMEYNYQHYKEKCGQLRTMQFNTEDHSITVTTYSPVTGRYYRDYMFGDRYTFTIENAF